MGTAAFAEQPQVGTIVQYGTMHEAVGKQQHQGRVQLNGLVKQPNFYAVAALERLAGEVTVLDDKVIISDVGSDGQLVSIEDTDGTRQAMMLVGAYVPSWTSHSVPKKCRLAGLRSIHRRQPSHHQWSLPGSRTDAKYWASDR
ncbi:hypothetical protein [Rubripirellula reticaptiva]|uniref:Uncharacterized protein n=1 Tax=Rubripirellula reticaptiva TaxID=2528013 RepID=A0A5C6EN36_9BACT|nr:hypothetical protein [Rubripirellula reticaptiva]TWU49061.1 hypothetical protein Poly59_36740 [Rubripirellula reticaptiva]